jgi:hypothetical protein
LELLGIDVADPAPVVIDCTPICCVALLVLLEFPELVVPPVLPEPPIAAPVDPVLLPVAVLPVVCAKLSIGLSETAKLAPRHQQKNRLFFMAKLPREGKKGWLQSIYRRGRIQFINKSIISLWSRFSPVASFVS